MNIDNIPEIQSPNDQAQNNSQAPNQKLQASGKPYELKERLLIFSKRTLHICKMLPRIPECEGIRKQLSNSATSIGANYEEADGALTKCPPIHQLPGCPPRHGGDSADRQFLYDVQDIRS